MECLLWMLAQCCRTHFVFVEAPFDGSELGRVIAMRPGNIRPLRSQEEVDAATAYARQHLEALGFGKKA